jgi:hypothetical protein
MIAMRREIHWLMISEKSTLGMKIPQNLNLRDALVFVEDLLEFCPDFFSRALCKS